MFWWGFFVLIGAFLGMEIVAWISHKFIMHGFMWYFHLDHHQPKNKLVQRNDIFFLIYAVPSWLCIMLGMMYKIYFPVFLGFGIALYGFAYFLVHDVYIHRRFKWLKKLDYPYFIALRKAHKAHHKHLNKEDGECFGMLLVPRKYYIEAKIIFQRKYNKP